MLSVRDWQALPDQSVSHYFNLNFFDHRLLVFLQRFWRMTEVQSSLKAYEVMRQHFNPYAEELWVLALNSQLALLDKEMIFRGTVNSCPLHPRDIFRFLIQKNATAFILAHNHPSNNPQPSEEDIKATRKIQKLGEILEICLLDHIVITENKYFSLADFGLIKTKLTARSPRRN